MSGYFRKNIAALAGYVPGEQPRDEKVIKLNTNENPYPPSPRVFAALRKAINRSLRLYPEPLADSLRAVAATVYGVKPENILAGNGSDEILSIIMRSFVGPQDRVAFPVPTYSLYDTLIAIQQGERSHCGLSAGFFSCRKHWHRKMQRSLFCATLILLRGLSFRSRTLNDLRARCRVS